MENLLVRKAVIWAEIKSFEQEYGRIQSQINELEQAKKDISFKVQERLSESQKIADKLLKIEADSLIKNNL